MFQTSEAVSDTGILTLQIIEFEALCKIDGLD